MKLKGSFRSARHRRRRAVGIPPVDRDRMSDAGLELLAPLLAMRYPHWERLFAVPHGLQLQVDPDVLALARVAARAGDEPDAPDLGIGGCPVCDERVRNHGIMMLLGSMSAGERLAAFLIDLSARYARLGFSPCDFHLRMTREDIGGYLGETLETVSRGLARFDAEGLIEVDQKHVRIRDLDGLARVRGP